MFQRLVIFLENRHSDSCKSFRVCFCIGLAELEKE